MADPEMLQAVCSACGLTNLGLQKRCLWCGERLQNLRPLEIEAEAATRISTGGLKGNRYCLVVLNGQLMGQRFSFGDGVSLGVNPANDVVLEDRLVSRRHARIERHGNTYVLVDLGSTNGTYVNDVVHKITSPVRLAVGNVITVGITRLRMELEDT